MSCVDPPALARDRAVLVRIAILALFCSACSAPPRSAELPRPGTAHFSIATFNVLHDAWSDRATVEAISALDADIVCLQEVNEPWASVLTRRYASTYAHRLFKVGGGSRGLAVLSRFALEDGGVLPPPPRGVHRAFIVYVQTPLGRVQLLDVHLRSLGSGQGGLLASYASSEQDHELEIAAFAARLQPGPTLVAGDFNEGPAGNAVRWLEQRGFANALPAFHPGQPTWRGRSIAGQLALTIDHILYDRSFAVLDARVVNAGNSDHLPVVATFRSASARH